MFVAQWQGNFRSHGDGSKVLVVHVGKAKKKKSRTRAAAGRGASGGDGLVHAVAAEARGGAGGGADRHRHAVAGADRRHLADGQRVAGVDLEAEPLRIFEAITWISAWPKRIPMQVREPPPKGT